jgi:hypothetical protein
VVGDFTVSNGRVLGVLRPAKKFYPQEQAPIAYVDYRLGLREDLYLVLGDFARDGSQATIKLQVNRLVSWIWIGGFVLTLGALLAILPERHRPREALALADPARRVPVLALLAYGFRVSPRDIPSPLVGRPAPGFALSTLDGAPMTLEGTGQGPGPQLLGVVVLSRLLRRGAGARAELARLPRSRRRRGGRRHPGQARSRRKFVADFGLTFPIAQDLKGTVSVDYGVYGVPETFFVDRRAGSASSTWAPSPTMCSARRSTGFLPRRAPPEPPDRAARGGHRGGGADAPRIGANGEARE